MEMDNQMRNAQAEAIKELGRIILLATLPILIAALSDGSGSIKAVATAAGIAALRALDAYIHERKDLKANGLVWF